jgi:arabinose-5-phosphate isomerase
MTIEQAREVLLIEAEAVRGLVDQLGPGFDRAFELIMNCPTRVIVAGIGKSGIIGQKIAATLNSTGTPAYFLHPVEAMHGDLGIVDPRDVVLAISYSGDTVEVNVLVASLRRRGNPVIAMTGNPQSPLAMCADALLQVSVAREACPLGLAPTASTTAALAMGDALAVVLLNRKGFQASDFRRNHPGGSLGERLKVRVSEVMLSGEQIPKVGGSTVLTAAIEEVNRKNIGAVLVIDEDGRLAGILTDGDIRRLVVHGFDLRTTTVDGVMTPAPKVIAEDLLAADALSIMQRHEITVLPVNDAGGRLVGVLHLQDMLGKGEFRFLV